MPGKVYLVGAGPGAPDLLTVRAARLLERADVVFHDALVHPDTIALAVHAQLVPVGKRSGRHSTAQRFINKRLVDAAYKHETVVRLKGGDPMLFGRAHEEIEALQCAGIEFDVVPGVTAALAASASLGISLTRRGAARNVVFLTPRAGEGEQANEWCRVAHAADTVVIYMGVGEAARIAADLIAAGKREDTPVAVVESATLSEERRHFLTLKDLPRISELGVTGPAVIMLGDVYTAADSAALASTPGKLAIA